MVSVTAVSSHPILDLHPHSELVHISDGPELGRARNSGSSTGCLGGLLLIVSLISATDFPRPVQMLMRDRDAVF